MATNANTPQLTSEIRRLLSGLRWRIRTYVWLDGIAMIAIWLGLTFWIGLALDYFPVIVLASEMPRELRAIGLAIILGVALFILWRWILRRTFARLRNESMALLLERRFDFHDSLVTAVELSEDPSHSEGFDGEMLTHTREDAQAQSANVPLWKVLRLSPLALKYGLAALLFIPMGGFYATNAQAFETWVKRIYFLQDEPWPRKARVEVVGIEVDRKAAAENHPLPATLVPFTDGAVRVAKGSSVTLLVRADAGAKRLPEYCTVYYETDDGTRSSVIMNKFRRVSDGYQMYRFAGKPFRGILSSLTFDVVGYDHRVGPLEVEVVESPAVVETVLACEYPAYLVDEESGAWVPRVVPYLSNGTQLPQGTSVDVRLQSNKPIQKAFLFYPESKQQETISYESDPTNEISLQIPSLGEQFSAEVVLQDTDGVISLQPHKIYITGIEDTAPQVEVSLAGISSMITPDAVLPATGRILDDYQVDRAWYEVDHHRKESRKTWSYPLAVGGDDQVAGDLDFRAERASDEGLKLEPGDKVYVTIKAQDRYDLPAAETDGEGSAPGSSDPGREKALPGNESIDADLSSTSDEVTPHVGSSSRQEIDVVTPDDLLLYLERLELAQRRRLNHIIEEMTASRNTLLRFKRELEGDSSGLEPEDLREEEGELSDDEAQKRARTLRMLRITQATMQSQKSAQEVLGVGYAFDDIVAQLVNNRVDSEDRKGRLEELVATPLKQVGNIMFPELDQKLEEMQKTFDDPEANAQATELAIDQANSILIELNSILNDMLDIASFNELVDHVRALLEEQRQLIKETDKEHKKSALELLE